MNGGKKQLDADEESKRKALQGIGRVHAEGITQDELTRIYDDWAEKYDDDINSNVYKGPEYVAEALSELYKESERKSIKVLDVAAGTGRIGIALHRLGFQSFLDALEPSAKMLEILSSHNTYGKQWMDTIGLHQTDIKDNYYDAIVSSGAFGGGHIPVSAIHEMVRVVKSGGYFVIILREEYLTTTEEYSKLEPLLNKLEEGKILKRINRKVVPNYSLDNNGVIFVYQIS
ncbi:hypothetical protein J437_LFUL003158 [Ladona fulva]|uniref:Methyltransferase type 11 domain-containing protein n=1 Tax=Ladona fulva TaxID=123851 RepID=A0A8K0KRZ5_LADFU|nr:hypothetical protein J437_LFUL003158 [Ladona fulva]